MKIESIKKSDKTGAQSLSELLNKDISLSFSGLFNDKLKEEFYSELSVLLESGLDLRTALDIFLSNLKKKKLIESFNKVQTEVIKGKALSLAMKEQNLISDYEYYSLEIGEESGKSIRILNELGQFFQSKIKQRQLVTKALSYPIVVSITAILAIVFMLTFVVPLFSSIFSRMGQDLPYITQVVMNFSHVVTENYVYVLLAIVLIFIIISQIKNHDWFRANLGKAILRIPFLGEYILKIHLMRFCSSMSLLIASGVNIIKCLDLMEKIVGFHPLKTKMPIIKGQILKGLKINLAMAEHNIFPNKMIALIKVGEEVNRMDDYFAKLNQQYQSEIEQKSNTLGAVLEPLILLFLGAVVAFVLIAMYLPMFNLSQGF